MLGGKDVRQVQPSGAAGGGPSSPSPSMGSPPTSLVPEYGSVLGDRQVSQDPMLVAVGSPPASPAHGGSSAGDGRRIAPEVPNPKKVKATNSRIFVESVEESGLGGTAAQGRVICGALRKERRRRVG